MHVFGSLGLLCALAGGGIGAYITRLWWQSGTIQPPLPLLMLSVLLIIVGIQFFCTGLLGDMLASLHQRGGRTPPISDRLGRLGPGTRRLKQGRHQPPSADGKSRRPGVYW